jgi:hypothetical protein
MTGEQLLNLSEPPPPENSRMEGVVAYMLVLTAFIPLHLHLHVPPT